MRLGRALRYFLAIFNIGNYTRFGKQLILYFCVLLVLAIAPFIIQSFLKFWVLVEDKQKASTWIEVAKTLATIGGGIFVFWNIRLVQEGQVTERYSKAVDQLGNTDNLVVRVGGVYALERIAKDSPQDHWIVMDLLTSFVRQYSVLKEECEMKEVTQDVQAALYVIGKRHHVNDHHPTERDKILNLSNTNLKGANLLGADLRGANLNNVYLRKADLSTTRLSPRSWIVFVIEMFGHKEFDPTPTSLCGADLRETNLQNRNLKAAKFQGAKLQEAKLQGAYMPFANLQSADLSCANLENAIFWGANLTDANLTEANVFNSDFTYVKGLTLGQVKASKNWQEAIFDKEFSEELRLVSQDN